MRNLAKKLSAIFISALMVIMTCITGITAMAATTGGSVTINNTKPGETYKLYRLLDVDYSTSGSGTGLQENLRYSVPSKYNSLFASLNLPGYSSATTPEKKGEIVYNYLKNLQNNSDELKAFAAKAASVGANNGTTSPEYTINAASTGTTTQQSNINYGYYLMIPDAGAQGSAVFSLNTVAPSAEIQNKSTYPTLTKKIIEGSNRVDSNMIAFGETYTYELTTAVPDVSTSIGSDGVGHYEFIIEDAITSQIVPNVETLQVKIGNDVLTLNEDYVTDFITLDSETNINKAKQKYQITNSVIDNSTGGSVAVVGGINFNDESKGIDFYTLAKQYAPGTPIVVTYNATLFNDEESIGTNGNSNFAALEFSKNIREKGVTPVDEVKTYTAGLNVRKKDNKGNPLSGATFTLKSVAAQGFAKADVSAVDVLDDNGASIGTYNASNQTWTFTTGENGYVRFEGLDEGVYELVETVAPSGFSLPDNAKVTIKIDATTPTEVVFGQDNVATFANDVTAETANIVSNVTGKTGSATVAFDYINYSQSVLPATGVATLLGVSAAGIAGVGLSFIVGNKKKREKSEK